MINQIVLFISILLISYQKALVTCQLIPNFYDQTCPNLSAIASSTFQTLARSNNVVAPSTLRLVNHDCFVQGCDASIMISSTSGNIAERDATDNDIPQQAFDTINEIKEVLELACPGVVSCADIIALAALESSVFLGGPSWQVPLGRRDSLLSQAAMVEGNIPKSNLEVPQLLSVFASKGLNLTDLVALSGAHTIGFSKCKQFTFRFENQQVLDPTIDPVYANQLQGKCPPNGGENTVPFDPVSPFEFDSNYFKALQAGRGLLFTDEILFVDNSTRATVNLFASSQDQFFQSFVNSMTKMISIGVLTGSSGEIRRDCSKINAAQNLEG